MAVNMYKRNKDMEIEDSLMIRISSYELFHSQRNFYSTTGHVSVKFLQKKANPLHTSYVNTTISVYIVAASRYRLGNKHNTHTLAKLTVKLNHESFSDEKYIIKDILHYIWYLTACKVSDIRVLNLF